MLTRFKTLIHYPTSSSSSSSSSEILDTQTNLIVIEHGMIGTVHKLSYLVNAFTSTNTYVYCTVSNVGILANTRSLSKQAINFGVEVNSFLEQHPQFTTVSFVGHSLGGITIRTTLHFLHNGILTKEQVPKLHAVKRKVYISMGSPHSAVSINSLQWWQLPLAKLAKLLRLTLIDELTNPETLQSTTGPSTSLEETCETVLLLSIRQDSIVSLASSQMLETENTGNFIRHVYSPREFWKRNNGRNAHFYGFDDDRVLDLMKSYCSDTKAQNPQLR
jgi:hypothetical protein